MPEELITLEAKEGDRISFPLSLELDTGRTNIGTMIVGVKDGKTVIFDVVVINPEFTAMFPDHWMGMSIPRVEEEVLEQGEAGEITPAEG